MIMSSLKESRVTLEWKRANTLEINEGATELQIMLLSGIVEKIYERNVKDRWMKYLEETCSLSNNQFRFREGS